MPNATAAPEVIPDFERGLFYCPSAGRPGTLYEAWISSSETGTVRVTCTCPAGRHARHGVPVPCRHARAVCELLEAHGLVERAGKTWTATERVTVAP